MNRKPAIDRDDAEMMAIGALEFLAQDAERLGRFLALTGLGPGDLRAAAKFPGFLAGVLDHLLQNEPLLIEFAASRGLNPGTVGQARAVLAGPDWEREVP